MQDSASGSQTGAALEGALSAADQILVKIGVYRGEVSGTKFLVRPRLNPPKVEMTYANGSTKLIDRTFGQPYIDLVAQIEKIYNTASDTAVPVAPADPRVERIATANAALRVVGDWSDDN